MGTKIKKLADETKRNLTDIYEFRAYTQLTYKYFVDFSKNGAIKTTAKIPHTGSLLSQDQIALRLVDYESEHLLTLAFCVLAQSLNLFFSIF